MNELEELEFAAREYSVATEHLIEILLKYGDDGVPSTIIGALRLLTNAINTEWDSSA